MKKITGCMLALAAAATPAAWGADTDIANSPMATSNMAKSNVMFVIDSSGGMDVDVLIPSFNSMYFETNSTAAQINSLDGFFYMQPTSRASAGSYYLGFTGNPDGNAWKARWYQNNPQYYNPYLTYKPWLGVDSTGAAFTNANPAAAYLDPYARGTTVNLQQWFSVPVLATYLSNATGPSTAIPAFTPVPTSTIQYCDSTAHTANGITYTKCSTGGARGYTSYMWPTSFYLWTDLNGNGVADAGEGQLYMINCSVSANPAGTPAGAPAPPPISNAPYGAAVSNAVFPWGRTCAQELQNFANWFQYSRTVMLSLKGAMGISLSVMGAAKVGMNDLQHATPVSPVADMSVVANLSALYAKVYSIIPNESLWDQPFHERIYDTWNYFNTPAGSVNPPAPVQYACEQNFEILVTPGYENDPGADTGSGFGGENYLAGPYRNGFTGVTAPAISPLNYDGTASALSWENGSGTNPITQSPFPRIWGTGPYTDTVGNTLADWAGYYYDKQLRTDLTAGQVPVPPQTQETNQNLHMSTYVLAPAAEPILETNGTFANPQTAMTSGRIYPPYPPSTQPVWPTVDPGCPGVTAPCFVGQSTIDDLWHTAVNGRGLFVNSSDVAGGLQLIVDDILARISAGAAVAVNNANIVQGANVSYASSFITGAWTGDLQSYTVNLNTGAPILTSPLWSPSAQGQLDATTPTQRYIATFTGSTAVPFTWAGITSGMQALLNTPPAATDGSTVLSFLRGDRTNEGTMYRTRTHVLGDIIHAEPVVVLPPSYGFVDPGYQAFVTANAGRTGMVYQGGNDGMLHAFVATTGAEAWAYVPGLLFNSRLASYPSTSTLVNLSLQTQFTHMYYVDATPAAMDVDFSYTNGNSLSSPPSPNWHTILVGGLAKGGIGFYALDVSNPAASSDAQVASKVLWEFPNSLTASPSPYKNIGYSFAKPVIAKTAAAGWVVLVTSGYNNGSDTGGDGQGHLFVLNPVNGSLIADIPTGAGTAATPSGLGQISGWANNANVDDTVSYVYGGDLLGNVWRFDLTAATTAGWTVSKLATLVDSTGNPQPVTSAPELGAYSGNHLIFVGTGEYLGSTDIPGNPSGSNSHATQTQTMYGLMDNLTAAPLISPLRANLVQQVATVSGSGSSATVTLTSNTVDYTRYFGWYFDLPTANERVNTDPALALGALIFTTNVPNTAACNPGGTSFEYFVNYSTGGYLSGSTVNGSNVPWSGMAFADAALASRPLLLKLPNGTIASDVRMSDATNNTTSFNPPGAAVNPKRIYWREIQTQ